MLLLVIAALCADPSHARLKARAVVAVSSSMASAKAASCRCGDNCPNGGNCKSCGCAEPKPAEPPGKPGPGWHWDADGKYWWRYGGVEGAPVAPAAAPPIAPAHAPPAAFLAAPAASYAMPAAFAPVARPAARAASCST